MSRTRNRQRQPRHKTRVFSTYFLASGPDAALHNNAKTDQKMLGRMRDAFTGVSPSPVASRHPLPEGEGALDEISAFVVQSRALKIKTTETFDVSMLKILLADLGIVEKLRTLL